MFEVDQEIEVGGQTGGTAVGLEFGGVEPVDSAVRLGFQVFLKTLCGAVIVILNATSFFCFQIVDLFDGELDVELRAGSNGDHGGLTEGEHVRPWPELAGLVYEEVVSVVVILVS